ncbi:HigA family addiction module antitoxin [Xenorhabdus sp. PB30.3]|uniref:HigA family addiction module antitoxin n=1 Tax=Xenorhabdus sp. PB30.3 TaxID=2788941 RepID=UPI001E35028B|nr:HigA family addiction module antitoxin [Xenorhabdus sp. PB30.3]MCC8379101.1 HigA family addiction module antidote protein [Xenorhabdus sp. PB30.3]
MARHIRPHIGQYISEEMAHLNMSLRELAQALDVSPSTIGRVMEGCAAVTPAMAERLACVLGSTPEMWLRLQEVHSLARNK